MLHRERALSRVYVEDGKVRDPVLEERAGADETQALGAAGDSCCSVSVIIFILSGGETAQPAKFNFGME